ncbi:hypothetical protein [Mycobacterium sp.]|uniref:hypothetical protein n=1 Tax=Mycobacterium sp. TaxID=1785 RepID=UPI003C72F118
MRIRDLLLADAAQVDAQAKIHTLGLGWTHIPTPTPPIAIVSVVELQPEEVPTAFEIKFELLDADKLPAVLPPDARGESGAFSVTGNTSAVWAENAPEWQFHEPMFVPFALTIGPGIPLDPGTYYFRATLNPESNDAPTELIRFRVRPPEEPGPPAPAGESPEQ